MFKRLSNHIRGNIMLLSLAFLSVTVAASLIITATALYGYYQKSAADKLSRAASVASVYFDSVESASVTLTKDPSVIDRLTLNTKEPLTAKLNAFCNLPQKINAASIYSLNGEIHSSPRIAGHIPLSTLLSAMQNAGLEDSDAVFWFRNTLVASIYDDSPYPETLGVISCVCKIYDRKGNLTGYLFADVLPSSLYSRFFNFENAYAFIGFESGGYSAFGSNDVGAQYFNEAKLNAAVKSTDRRYVVHRIEFLNGNLTAAATLTDYRQTMLYLSLILCGISAAALSVVYLISRYMSNTVTKRLTVLYEKMNNLG